MEDLFLSDKEFESVRDTYHEKIVAVEAALQSYIKVTKSVVLEGKLEGSAANALLQFIELTEDCIKGELDGIVFRHKVATGSFIDNLSDLDDTGL